MHVDVFVIRDACMHKMHRAHSIFFDHSDFTRKRLLDENDAYMHSTGQICNQYIFYMEQMQSIRKGTLSWNKKVSVSLMI